MDFLREIPLRDCYEIQSRGALFDKVQHGGLFGA
jgi:hypothetical protein